MKGIKMLQRLDHLNQRRGNSDRPLCQFSTNARNEKFRDETGFILRAASKIVIS
jgi:hypothetical protein